MGYRSWLVLAFLALGMCSFYQPAYVRADDTQARIEQGTDLLKSGRPDEAIDIFSSLIAGEPRPEFHYHRALAYGQKQEYQPALDDLEIAIAAYPRQAGYHLQKGIWLLRAGRIAEAVTALTTAVELEPTNAKACAHRARAYLRQRNAAKAAQDAQIAIKLNPAIGAWYVLRGDILVSLGDHGKAVQDYNQALDLRPGDAVAHNNRGVALANLGKTREAVEDLNRAMDIASSVSASGNGHNAEVKPW